MRETESGGSAKRFALNKKTTKISSYRMTCETGWTRDGDNETRGTNNSKDERKTFISTSSETRQGRREHGREAVMHRGSSRPIGSDCYQCYCV